jgi:ribonuclease P protein component
MLFLIRLKAALCWMISFSLDGCKGPVYIGSSNEMIKRGEDKNEKNISTIKCEKNQRSWLPETDVHQGRAEDSKKTQGKKKKQIVSSSKQVMTKEKDLRQVRNEGFPQELRIKKEAEFREIIEEGAKRRGKNLIVFRLQDGEGKGQKFGIKISRGVRGAVRRNQIKRVIREVIRKNKGGFDKDEKVVVMFRGTAGEVDPRMLKEELESLIR